MNENLIGKLCNFAQTKHDGGLFWRHGRFMGENPTHFLFEIEGKPSAFLRTEIARIEWEVD